MPSGRPVPRHRPRWRRRRRSRRRRRRGQGWRRRPTRRRRRLQGRRRPCPSTFQQRAPTICEPLRISIAPGRSLHGISTAIHAVTINAVANLAANRKSPSLHGRDQSLADDVESTWINRPGKSSQHQRPNARRCHSRPRLGDARDCSPRPARAVRSQPPPRRPDRSNRHEPPQCE